MKTMKRYGLIAAAAAVLAVLAYFLFFRTAPAVEFNRNLLVNGDFSQTDGDGNPAHWYKDAYAGLTGSDFDVVQDENGVAAHIVNHIPKDARFAQEANVEPDTLYLLHGYIKADASGGRGANLSIEGVYVFSQEVYDSQGEWQEIRLYGRTGKDQRTVTVFVRLGGYSGEATGEAYFRDISLCKVEGIAEGYTASLWQSVSYAQPKEEKTEQNASFLLVLCSLAYLFFFVFLCRYLRRPKPLEKETGLFSGPWLAAAFFLAALILRLVIAAVIPGYDVDIGCFRAWAEKMASVGPAGFYPADDPFSFCDYPPGYMWILWLLGGLGRLLGTGVTEFMVKVPPAVADIALCAVLYVCAKKHLSAPAALALSLLFAFNPLSIAVGAAWGQADVLMTLLLLLAVLFAVRGVWRAALPLYIAAVLFKPQALMFGPLGLTAFCMDAVRAFKKDQKDAGKIRDMLLGLVFMAVTGLAIALPFSLRLSWDWLITLYSKTMGRYAYATVNACNIYFLLGKNWVSASSALGSDFFLPLLVYLLGVLPLGCAVLSRRLSARGLMENKKDRLGMLALGGAALALGFSLLLMGFTNTLTYATLGTAMIVYCVAVILILYVWGHDVRNLPIFGAVLLLLLFNTGSMMHERYLFPAVALLLLGYVLKKDTRVLWLAVGVTISGFLNVGCVLDRNIRIGGASGHLTAPAVSLTSDMAVLEYVSAALNTVLCFASLWLCAALAWGNTVEMSADNPAPSPLPMDTGIRKMTVRDWVILSAITAVYAVLAFSDLGSMKAPQTAFVANSPDEQVVLDLGENRSFNVLYYGGIHQYDSDFTVEISADGQLYDQQYTAGMPIGDCFKWKYLSSISTGTYPVTLTGRYVRLTAEHYNLTLYEVLFRDAETGETLQATVVSDRTIENNETVYALVDEPDSMEGDYPSWKNSTYFDEIYHARTAYELLHKMQPYEYTHPPLGKVFMSWCIAIFGMTPFGWRFAGALAGVLMLPGMYLLGKLLIKRTWGGMGAALLLALDLMHFTQTRIATIDSFVVLFIIWMVYFMLRWFFLDFFHTPLLKTLIPLALSGICMGLGVASKWTGCYAGVVLALLFFFGVWRRGRLVAAARKKSPDSRSADEALQAEGGKKLALTVACCLVFFVLVPLVIYYCAYIPFFAYDGAGVSVKKIIAEAERMFSYHSQPGLGMDHSFYSPWYQWPIIGKPMWYSSNAFEPDGYQMSISAMGNPVLWWGGLAAVVCLACVWLSRHLRRDGTLTLHVKTDDPRCAILLTCYFVQLLPWILVPRGTYIYHYFPCVPFLALSITLCLDMLADRMRTAIPEGMEEQAVLRRVKTAEWTAWGLLALILITAAVLFVAFFPYASGWLSPQSWMEKMQWFPSWLWIG